MNDQIQVQSQPTPQTPEQNTYRVLRNVLTLINMVEITGVDAIKAAAEAVDFVQTLVKQVEEKLPKPKQEAKDNVSTEDVTFAEVAKANTEASASA